jgi:hypothetical protein
VKLSHVKTVVIELTEEEATHLRNILQQYRDGAGGYMTGNTEEDEFADKFLGYISVEVHGA